MDYKQVTVKSNDMDLRFALILITVIGLIAFIIYRRSILPARRLNEAVRHMAEGDFEHTVPQSGRGRFRKTISLLEGVCGNIRAVIAEKEESEKETREVISNISHDLRTPITSIKGYVEGIMDGVADTPEKMERYIKTIYNKANDMDHLINELTLYSRLDTNSIPYNYHMLNVCEYFNDAALDTGLELESKGIRLEYSNTVSEDVVIVADPEQLRRVINNIISNSIKYMETEEGVISISITDMEDSIKVEISDNGKGIALKDLPNVFDRFYRSDVSRNSSKMGSGIGLSIVRKIIEDHGGYVWATSVEGKGATINFTLHKYEDRSMAQTQMTGGNR
ncbi:MAG: HAMP domain-containing histidine kinase [Lachnospiraceae bacterium]|nr:HAMP domain-containing histidine kinase [Lachnospiraceae bacterium]